MEIPAVGTTPISASALGANSLAETFDSFLLLLTTQLQHQDPLDPMDSGEFTQQLVQFTGVEQALATNANLEHLIALFRSTEFSGAVQYLGKIIGAPGATTTLENGNAEWSYALGGQATETTVKVLNDKGIAVFSAPGKIGSGVHDFVWDGNDNAGNPVPDGDYTLSVRSLDEDGNDLPIGLRIFGRVSGVQTEAGVTTLSVGGTAVSLKDVVSVKEPPSGT